MSFDIFAAGSGHFNYERRQVADGDAYELSWAERQLLGRGGIRARPSPTSGALGHVTTAASRLTQVHLFSGSVEIMQVELGAGTLFIAARQEHLIGPDSGGNLEERMPGDSGSEIVVRILRFLEGHGLNTWGVVIELLDAFTRFTQHGGRCGARHRGFHLLVQLTRH